MTSTKFETKPLFTRQQLTALLLPTTPVWIIVLTLFLSGLVRSMQFSSLTTLAFADIPEHDMTSANTLYSTIQQMSIGMGIAIGAVALRFSNVLNGGVPGQYTIPDFRLAFFFVTAIGFLHLFGYGDFSSRLHPSRRLAVATNFLRVRKFNSHRRNAENIFFMWLRQKSTAILIQWVSGLRCFLFA